MFHIHELTHRNLCFLFANRKSKHDCLPFSHCFFPKNVLVKATTDSINILSVFGQVLSERNINCTCIVTNLYLEKENIDGNQKAKERWDGGWSSNNAQFYYYFPILLFCAVCDLSGWFTEKIVDY